MSKQKELEQLISMISRFPGLGRRSAIRLALYLLSDREKRLDSFINMLNIASRSIRNCEVCFNFCTSNKCEICLDNSRDNNIIAIVENVANLWSMERSRSFRGRYHILGKNLSTISADSGRLLNLDLLKSRVIKEKTQELIIGLSTSLDGQTTSYYISDYFKGINVKLSRLASGIPIGGDLDYIDEGTLSAAISARQIF